jgi:hypothetical protein
MSTQERDKYLTQERDKYLTKAIGECCHEWEEFFPSFICRGCGIDAMDLEDNLFSTWQGFGKLWGWATKQDWWKDFWYQQLKVSSWYCSDTLDYQASAMADMVNPDTFANAVYVYLKEAL